MAKGLGSGCETPLEHLFGEREALVEREERQQP